MLVSAAAQAVEAASMLVSAPMLHRLPMTPLVLLVHRPSDTLPTRAPTLRREAHLTTMPYRIHRRPEFPSLRLPS